jgi:ABC-type uncharacterized transport system auxiliary subunit
MRKVQTTPKSLFLLLALLAMSGCISLPSSSSESEPPPSIYTLHPLRSANAEPTGPAKTSAIIVVSKPEVPTGFDTERIALYFEQGRRLDYYADAKWSGRLDDLLQDFIIQTARHDLPGKVVDTTDLAAAAQFKLSVKITDFQPVYPNGPDSAPRLDVAMTVTLITVPGGTVKANVSVKQSAPASANRLSVITKELEALLQSLTDQALREIAPHLAEP